MRPVLETVRDRAFIKAASEPIRRSAGLSFAQIGQQLDVAPSTVWRWEKGYRNPRPDHAHTYAELLREIAAAK